VATYDYPYFNLRLTWGGELKLRYYGESQNPRDRGAVGRAGGARGGWCFSLHQRVPPTPHPRWYSNIAYNNTPSALKAALGRVRLLAVGVAGLKSLPLARRVGASFQRPLECIRTSYRSNIADRCPSGPRSTFTDMLSRPAAG